jgi:hypothetical protein
MPLLKSIFFIRMQIIKKPASIAAILLKLVGYLLEWIKNRKVITVLICILVVTAAIIIVVLLCGQRGGNYTNAWYVKRSGCCSPSKAALRAGAFAEAGLAAAGNSYNIQFAAVRQSEYAGSV